MKKGILILALIGAVVLTACKKADVQQPPVNGSDSTEIVSDTVQVQDSVTVK
jgi:hypothetical protein